MNWFPIKDFPCYQISEDRQCVRLVTRMKQTFITYQDHKGIEKVTSKEYSLYKDLIIHESGVQDKYVWLWSKKNQAEAMFWLEENKQVSANPKKISKNEE